MCIIECMFPDERVINCKLSPTKLIYLEKGMYYTTSDATLYQSPVMLNTVNRKSGQNRRYIVLGCALRALCCGMFDLGDDNIYVHYAHLTNKQTSN